MYKIDNIEHLHIELTDKCQAACPMCDRNIRGGKDNPHLRYTEITLDNFKTFFEESFIKQLNAVTFCGNLGDPIIASDTLEIIKFIKTLNPKIWVSMNTNGGARTPQWWEDLAKVLDKKGVVVFSIDGLEDTNHIYRQNVSWEKVISSVKSYINSGGRARWDFLIFGHNEHQLEEAKKFSEALGFEEFISKKSARFFSTSSSTNIEKSKILDKKGNEKSNIERPKNKENLNKELSKEEQIIKEYGSMDNFYDVSKIDCKVAKQKSLYISAEGLVLPCCWVAGRMYKWWLKEGEDQVWKFIDQIGGKNKLSLHNHSLSEIFETGFFDNIRNSWSINSCKNGKSKVCAMKCSTTFDIFNAQFK